MVGPRLYCSHVLFIGYVVTKAYNILEVYERVHAMAMVQTRIMKDKIYLDHLRRPCAYTIVPLDPSEGILVPIDSTDK